jgi:LysR family transcriptional regulator for metE and metH
VILLLVASRRGVAVLPDWVVRATGRTAALTTRPLGQHGMHGTLYAAVRRADAASAFLHDFIALARATHG